MSSRALRWVVLALGVALGVALDQIAKAWATASLPHDRVVPVIAGFFELRYARNPGAFFNLGSDLAPWLRTGLFLVAAAIALVMIARMYAKTEKQQRLLRVGLALLMAGAIGNAVDRVVRGEVTDFAHAYWRGVFDWATFNVADAWITIGLILLVVDMLVPRRGAARKAS